MKFLLATFKHKERQYKKVAYFYVKYIALCLIAGWGAGFFSVATDKAFLMFKHFYLVHPWRVLILTPSLFMVTVFLLQRSFPYAGGSGLPQGYALDAYKTSSLYATYSVWTMFGKMLLTLLSIVSGAALGREGPTIQICASIFGSMKNISLSRKKMLIRIGSGIGVATAFNAPLGGIMFAFEEYLKVSNVRVNTLLLLGVAIAGHAAIAVYGDYSYLGTISSVALKYDIYTLVIALTAGVVCGLIGALFTSAMVYVSVDKGQWLQKFRRKHAVLLAGICGLGLALVGIFSDGAAFGNGAFEMRDALVQGINLPWHYGLSKGVGAVLSVAGGVPGGYFSTALSIGAGLMHTIYRFFPVLPLEQFYLLGMAGFLAAITNAPLTAMAMIISIAVGSQHFMLPIIITSLLAAHIANMFGDSVYHQQVLIYIDRSKYYETR